MQLSIEAIESGLNGVCLILFLLGRIIVMVVIVVVGYCAELGGCSGETGVFVVPAVNGVVIHFDDGLLLLVLLLMLWCR